MPADSIPTHAAGRTYAVTRGVFVKRPTDVVLSDKRGNIWPLEFVSIITSFWGRSEDGTVKLPRPEVRVADKVMIEGDEVVVLFLDGNYSLPIVMGASRSFKPNTFEMPYAHDDGSDPLGNVLKGRLRYLVEATGDGPAPATAPWQGDEVAWSVNEEPGVAKVKASQYTEATHFFQSADSEWTIRGQTFLADLQNSLIEITNAFTALGVPMPDTTQLIFNIGQSNANNAPYLSSAFKVE